MTTPETTSIAGLGLSESARNHAMIGSTLDGYTLTHDLGSGGMSRVFLAGAPDGGNVVLKLARRGDGSAASRLARELAITRGLAHPGLVELVSHRGPVCAPDYLVLGYIEGQPLDRFVTGAVPSPTTRLELFAELLAACAHLHGRGVVHRDLKPANIMVDGKRKPIVIDFGAALKETEMHVEDWANAPHTPGYASPEQLAGLPCDARADVYALGLILYELVCGHHAYLRPGSGCLDPLQATRSPPLRPSALLCEIDAGPGLRDADAATAYRVARCLDEVVMRCLAHAPEQRYVDGRALAAGFGEAVAPLAARDRGRTRHTSRFLIGTDSGVSGCPVAPIRRVGQSRAHPHAGASPQRRLARRDPHL